MKTLFTAIILTLIPTAACARTVVPMHPVAELAHYHRVRTVACIEEKDTGFCNLVARVLRDENEAAGCLVWAPGGNVEHPDVIVVQSGDVPGTEVSDPNSRLGETRLYTDGKALVIVNIPLVLRSGAALYSVILHELLHAHGADHVKQTDASIMRPACDPHAAGGLYPADKRWLRSWCGKQ
jgi:hypothetical protein